MTAFRRPAQRLLRIHHPAMPAQRGQQRIPRRIVIGIACLKHSLSLRSVSKPNDAEKEKASFPTHLLRAEKVPFDVLILLSFMFFNSNLLKLDLFTDLFTDQFPR